VQQAGHPDLEPVLGEPGQQVGRGQVGDDRAVPDDRDPVREFLHDGQLVGGQHDRLALADGQVRDPVLHRPCCLDVQADRRLVQQQDRRVGDQRGGDRHFLLHPAGVRPHALVPPLPQAQAGQQPLRPRPDLLPAQALQPPEVHQVLPRGQRPVHVPGPFQHRADLPHCIRALPPDVVAVDPDRAGGGQDQPAGHLDRGGLARAVRPQQADHLPGRDGERDVVHGCVPVLAPPVLLGQAGQLDRRPGTTPAVGSLVAQHPGTSLSACPYDISFTGKVIHMP